MKIGISGVFEKASFASPVNFSGLTANGGFSLFQASFKSTRASLTFNGARIRGLFLVSKAIFAGEADFEGANLNDFTAEETTFAGPVSFLSATISGNFVADNARFTNPKSPLRFDSVKASGNIFLRKAIIAGSMTFTNAEVGGDLRVEEASFDNPEQAANFDGVKVVKSVVLKGCMFVGTFSIVGAKINNQLIVDTTKFKSKKDIVNFDRLTVGDAVSFSSISSENALSISDTNLLSLSVRGQERESGNNSQLLRLLLSRTVVKRDLNIVNMEIGELIADFLRIETLFSVVGVTISQRADLKNTSSAIINFDDVSWPKGKDSIRLSGLNYQEIYGGSDDGSSRKLLDLVNSASYDLSVYATLENYLRRKGNIEASDAVFLAQKERERRLSAWSTIDRWWSMFLNISVAHGRAPERCLYASVVVVLFGWLMFRKGRMEPRKDADPLERYWAFWYSLGLFLPFVELHIEEVWRPKQEHWFPSFYVYLHRLFGWILVPIWLAAWTGLIQ
jgi:hypothetical protein